MRRSDVMALLTTLGMRGMKAAYDELVAEARRGEHGIEWLLGRLLEAEVADKRARSIKYQLTIAKLPSGKELSEFDFGASPVDEAELRRQAEGSFIERQRNLVLIGGTETDS